MAYTSIPQQTYLQSWLFRPLSTVCMGRILKSERYRTRMDQFEYNGYLATYGWRSYTIRTLNDREIIHADCAEQPTQDDVKEAIDYYFKYMMTPDETDNKDRYLPVL